MYKFFMHSCYMKKDDFDVVIVNEKRAIPNEDGTIKFENALNFIENPKRSYFIHKEKYICQVYSPTKENDMENENITKLLLLCLELIKWFCV